MDFGQRNAAFAGDGIEQPCPAVLLENGRMFDVSKIDALNSATKYSILTYHALGERGALTEELTTFDGFDDTTYLRRRSTAA